MIRVFFILYLLINHLIQAQQEKRFNPRHFNPLTDQKISG
jgi:hypothetical protein